MKLREFPLTAVCAVAVNGLFRASVSFCALFPQTQVFTFLNSPYPQLLVDMLHSLVQGLFRARVSGEIA